MNITKNVSFKIESQKIEVNFYLQWFLKWEFWSHYSKSQIFVQKFNFDKTPTFSRIFHPKFFWQFFSWNQSCQQLKSPKPRHFHEFFTQNILTIFLGKSKLSTAKKPKTTTFSRVFPSKKIDNFLGKWKLNFWTKNEDFEQCDMQSETLLVINS